jgi:hypothetical protein
MGARSAASPRPQLVVVVDTDARLVDELASRPDVSEDAAIDSLRVDVLDDSNHEYDSTTFSVAEFSRWPISFGVAAPQDRATAEVHLRLRAFRATFAREGQANGGATLDPPPEIAVDRLAWIPLPAGGVTSVRILYLAVRARAGMHRPAPAGPRVYPRRLRHPGRLRRRRGRP